MKNHLLILLLLLLLSGCSSITSPEVDCLVSFNGECKYRNFGSFESRSSVKFCP